MLKLINLKKLTAKTLIGILVAGSLITQSGTKEAIAGQCSNNGHGNNGDITFTLSNGTKILLTKFDPSNPGNGNQIERELKDSNPGITDNEVKSAISIIKSSNFDFERKPTSDIDADCDNIVDLTEAGTDVNNPLDTDKDGTPNFVDTDSDNDDVLDSVEGTGDSDNDGIPNYIDATNNLPSTTTSSSGTGSRTGSSTSNAPSSITLTGTIRDFKASHDDFEFGSENKQVGDDRGIVTAQLGVDKKPVYAKETGETLTTSGKANFDQWYRDVAGVNQNKEYSIELERQSDGTYKYQNNSFFPINGQLFGNFKDNKNYHFTYEIHTKFTYKGGEKFTFSGDDDVWVYIDGKRVIDIGGVHTSQTQNVNLDSLGLTAGKTYDLDFFFAERNYSQSNFTIVTNIELKAAPNPDGDDDNDGITNILEGSDKETDTDKDGTPDYKDNDSDKNGVLDQDEVGETPANPTDSDSDGVANFMDTDDDGNGRPDVDEIGSNPKNPTNTDKQDLPDYQDLDDDNDKIVDKNEIGSNPQSPIDTDQDGTPDYHDVDSDGDTLSDSVEGMTDFDRDGTPNFQDTDSDGDGIFDKNETIADSDGDGKSDVKKSDLTSPKTLDDVDGDGKKNYQDNDSDGDGIQDNVDSAPYIPQAD